VAAQATNGRGTRLPSDLFDANVEVHRDLVRNIPGIRRSQDLFDDLSDDPDDWAVAMAAESAGRIQTASAVATRPFDYGTVISYTFETAHWQATRFSDGTRYGVWYGSWDTTTTVYETAYHWSRFVRDSFAGEDRAIRTERRVFDVRCDALLIDLRAKVAAYPGLVDRRSYAFCQDVVSHVHEQGQNGLLVRSARCAGVNAAIFRADRLREVRDKLFLNYRYNPARDELVVERTPGRVWMKVAPSSLE
jgi:hypothetical protein